MVSMCTDKGMFFKVTDIKRVNTYSHSYEVYRTLTAYEYFLIFVNSGQVSFFQNGNSYNLSCSDFVMCQSGDAISYTAKKDSNPDFFLVSFETDFESSSLPLMPGQNKCTDKDSLLDILYSSINFFSSLITLFNSSSVGI